MVAARLRSMGKKATHDLTAVQEWQPMGESRMVAERCLGGWRLVLRTCRKKAAKDAHDREKAVEKAKLNLAQGVKGKGRRGRFLDQGAVSLDVEAIEKDQAFDDLHRLWTSLETLAPQDVYAQYGELWRIEEGFRVHTTAVRPICQWTEHRVKAHIAICFVAFAPLRILRYHNSMHGGKEPLSEARILSELSAVEVSVLQDQGTGKRYLVPAATGRQQINLYKAVGLTLQRNTVPLKEGSGV